jgi:small subunit ribosomal protein S18
MARNQDFKYLNNKALEKRPKKYCRFKKMGIEYIDYKDGEFLKKFINDQGKILPRRITGNSLKFQRKVATAVKKARQMAILPYLGDLIK